MKYLVVFALLLAIAVPANCQVVSHAPTNITKPTTPPNSSFQVSDKPVARVNGAVLTEHDLLLIVGTSGAVYPAGSLPQLAKNRGAVVIEINPSETDLSDRARDSNAGRIACADSFVEPRNRRPFGPHARAADDQPVAAHRCDHPDRRAG